MVYLVLQRAEVCWGRGCAVLIPLNISLNQVEPWMKIINLEEIKYEYIMSINLMFLFTLDFVWPISLTFWELASTLLVSSFVVSSWLARLLSALLTDCLTWNLFCFITEKYDFITAYLFNICLRRANPRGQWANFLPCLGCLGR